MRTKRQQIDAAIGTIDFLRRLSSSDHLKKIPRAVRKEAKTLLQQFPAEEDLRAALDAQLVDIVYEPTRVTLTDWVRNRYKRTMPIFEEAEVPIEIE